MNKIKKTRMNKMMELIKKINKGSKRKKIKMNKMCNLVKKI